jgi:L-asparagine transporter-like permease
MKKLAVPFILIAIIVGIYEQSKEKPNLYVTVGVIIIFMIGMIQFSSKVPSKNQDEEEND